ncbi:hypothetical protein LIER_37376 [Lithospermum erythrorhizon]|uniref:CCHC-type domain-containing protein n=1 Tax=Lithospermum erythrorhizon TaxID=34254 RepID=A0AAV3PJI9_LITER
MDAEIIQELLGFDTCDFLIQVRGLKGEYLTRDVAGKIGNTFQGYESVELGYNKQEKKFFRLKATVMIHQPIRRLVNFKVGSSMVSGYLAYERLPNMCFHCGKLGHLIKQCPYLDPGKDCTTKVVYGLWIKAPLERSWIDFKLMDKSAFQRSSPNSDRACFWEAREGGDIQSGASSDPILEPNRLLQIRDTDLVADDPLGEEILSKEVAEYPAPPQTLAENSTKNKEDSGMSDTRKDTLAFFNFKSNNGLTAKGKAPMSKCQSKKRHHPYQTAKNLSSPSKKLAVSNLEGEVFSTTNKSTKAAEQLRQQ